MRKYERNKIDEMEVIKERFRFLCGLMSIIEKLLNFKTT